MVWRVPASNCALINALSSALFISQRKMLAAAAMRLGGVAAASALPAVAAAAAFAPACHTAFTKLAPSLVQLERFSASRVGCDACPGRLWRLVQYPPPTACASPAQRLPPRWYQGTCLLTRPPTPVNMPGAVRPQSRRGRAGRGCE